MSLNFIVVGEKSVHRTCFRDQQLLVLHCSHDSDMRALHFDWGKASAE